MTCDSTWPNPSGTDKDATQEISKCHGVEQDIAYGKTKVFIRSPQTLTLLEQERANHIPQVVTILQKVLFSQYISQYLTVN